MKLLLEMHLFFPRTVGRQRCLSSPQCKVLFLEAKEQEQKNKTDARARVLSLRTSGPWLCDSALVTMETAELEKQISASQAQILLIRKCFY